MNSKVSNSFIGGLLLLLHSMTPVLAANCSKVIAISPAIQETLTLLGVPSQTIPTPPLGRGQAPIAWEALLAQEPSHILLERQTFYGVPPPHASIQQIDWSYTIQGILQATQTVADICDQHSRFQTLVDEWQTAIQNQQAAQVGHARPSFIVLYADTTLQSTPEWYAGGRNFHTELLEILGGRNVLQSTYSAEKISTESLLLLRPEVIVFVKESSEEWHWQERPKNQTGLAELPLKARIVSIQGKGVTRPTMLTLLQFLQKIRLW